MTTGVSYNSVSAAGTFTQSVGTADANYPVTNLGDLVNINKVARLTQAGGNIQVTINFASAKPVQFVGLVNHDASSTMRARAYSAASGGGSLLADSGTVSIWPTGGAVAGYPSVRPVVFTAEVQAMSLLIDIASAGTVEIGGIEIGQWLPMNVGPGKQFGFANRVQPTALIGGGQDDADAAFMPRLMSGEIPLVSLGPNVNALIDFQAYQHRSKPFVYVEDYDDPTSWARRCFLARNQELPASVGALYRSDKFQLRFIEHRR